MSETMRVSEQALIADIEHRLNEQFPDLMPAHVYAAIRAEHARFRTCPIRDFIPLLVEKHVRRQLADTVRR